MNRRLVDVDIDKDKDLIAVSNTYALTKKMSLSPMATKLYIWCVSQIKKSDGDRIRFEITAEDFEKSFNSKSVKRDLDRVTDELMNFKVFLQEFESGRWDKINVMSSCSYDPEQRKAFLSYTKEGWECFVRLSGGDYASGALQIFTEIDNIYAFNVYMFLHNYLKKKEVTISLDELRETIGATAKSYDKWAHFNANVLKILKESFDEHSTVKFDYEATGKVGRKFTKVRFFNIRKDKTQGQLFNKGRNICKKGSSMTPDAKEMAMYIELYHKRKGLGKLSDPNMSLDDFVVKAHNAAHKKLSGAKSAREEIGTR